MRNPLRDICTVGTVREETSRWCHGHPKRARSWKRRIQLRKNLQPIGTSPTRRDGVLRAALPYKNPSAGSWRKGICVWPAKNLLLVIDGSAMDLFARRIGSACGERPGLAVSRGNDSTGARNFALLFDGQLQGLVVDRLV